MSRISIISVWLAALALSACATAPAPQADHKNASNDASAPQVDRKTALNDAAAALAKWDHLYGAEQQRDVIALRRSLETLESLHADSPSDPAAVVTHYFIGRIEFSLALKAKDDSNRFDTKMGEDAIRNSEFVISAASDHPELSEAAADANLLAGNAAYQIDGNEKRALRYWRVCASQGHPGCVNNVANALIEAPSPSDDDLRTALELHARVANTGTRAHCAGEFSAVTMAKIIYFTGVERPGDDAIEWMEKARGFWRELQKLDNNIDACNGASLNTYEYLMLLDRGERRPALLDEASKIETDPFSQSVIKFVSGQSTESAFFGSLVGATPDESCAAHFYGLWRAEQDGQIDAARKHLAAMRALHSDTCDLEVAFGRKYIEKAEPDQPKG